MELVNVGVLQATIVDEPKARMFAKIFDKVLLREDIAIIPAATLLGRQLNLWHACSDDLEVSYCNLPQDRP
jgi:hypothetical protein